MLSNILGKGYEAKISLDKSEDKQQEERSAGDSLSGSSGQISDDCWSVGSTESDKSDCSLSTVSNQERDKETLNKWLEEDEDGAESIGLEWAKRGEEELRAEANHLSSN